jgi:hypothetical protein
MAIPSIPSKTLTSCLTYFLYHIHLGTKISKKIEASFAYLQLETGLFGTFFLHPFTIFGILATKTLGRNDIPLMEYAAGKYNKIDMILLNKYRIYWS